MSKHTPAPWTTGYHNRCFEIRGPNNEAIATTGVWLSNETSEMEANAHLIAAAPQMRAAMQEFCERVERGEVRSKYTYSKFQTILKAADGEGES